jgi:hypothetical protein
MLLDALNAPSNPQTLTVSAASTDYIDFLAAKNLGWNGSAKPSGAFVEIGTPTGTAPTLVVTLQGADDAAFSVNLITIATATPTLVSGTAYGRLNLGIASHTPKRYVRFNYTVGGTTPNIPIIYAGLAWDQEYRLI